MQAPSVLKREAWPPNYTDAFMWRQQMFLKIKDDPKLAFGALEYYRTHPVEFVVHWMDTFDPRNAFNDLPTRLPFVLFERQAALIEFLMACLTDESNGLIDKSRDMGATWVACGFSVWLWRFYPGASVGWGSRKENLVDKIGDPDSIFEKMRMIIKGLPRFFWPPGFDQDKHMTFMRIVNPDNNATITGEAGDNIGRGGRKLIYLKDESAHYEHPESIEAALMDNTRVQIDISTVNGVGTVFDRKREAGTEWRQGAPKIPKGTTRVFVMDWRDHPMKDEAWHAMREKEAKDNGLLHLFRQEVDRNPSASLQGIVIPAEWVHAAIDAHVKLKFGDDGMWSAAFDVADEGGDLNALTFRKGSTLKFADDWGEDDTGKNTRRVIKEAESRAPLIIWYDCLGPGAGVKAETNRLVTEKTMPRGMRLEPWNAGGSVLNPEENVIKGDSKSPLNKDFYGNVKAQGWWHLRRRFEKTFRALTEGIKFPPEELISLSSQIPKLRQIERELSQPTITHDGRLRMIIDKKPEGTKSPNMADAIMMNYFPLHTPMVISDAVLRKVAMAGGRRR